MILKELELFSDFRGLPSGYKIIFNNTASTGEGRRSSENIEPICLVGLNGSGKSNILEVLAEIFFYLESYTKADRFQRNGLQRFKTSFGFKISYEMPRDSLLNNLEDWPKLYNGLQSMNLNSGVLISITKNKDEFPVFKASFDNTELVLDNKNGNREPGILPVRVIGYSSGMNELLSNPFIKMDFQYLSDLNAKRGEVRDSRLDMNRMFFMNYDSNKYIAVSNFMFDADDFERSDFGRGNQATDFGGINLKPLKNETGITDISYFSIRLQLEKSIGDSSDYLPSELNIALEKLERCATFYSVKEEKVGKNKLRKVIEYDYWVNSATKQAFRDQFRTAYDLFRAFYFLELLNNQLVGINTRELVSKARAGDIENLSEELPRFEKGKLIFRLHNIKLKKLNSRSIEYRKLSDGEHQLLQVIGSLLLMDADGSLFLFDEPDTHFNPDWRSKLVQLINVSISQGRSQEFLLTTHSPFIISDCKPQNVFIFERNANGKVKNPRNPEFNTYGAAVSIITDGVFDKSETVSDMPLATIEQIKKRKLDTIEDIQQAKEAARVLGNSPEKVLLFRELLMKEDELRGANA
jgi:restriction system-associated AAA family ATPase